MLLRAIIVMVRELFDRIPIRNVISWNTKISWYAQIGQFHEDLSLFQEMRKVKATPNMSTLLNILSICAHFDILEIRFSIRSWIKEHGYCCETKMISS